MAEKEEKPSKQKKVMEELETMKLQASDNPGMSLVSSLLNGKNYLPWSRSIRIALGAKMKLGFINGKSQKPNEDSDEYEQWVRNDCMVTSWILNSISKEIVETFLYVNSARELWTELETHFGESNGPLEYQIQREIAFASQENLSISTYYAKLKRLWDELAFHKPIPQCECGASKILADMNLSNQLMQFLMGLHESFDHVRNQILLMEPLPSVNKAYSMVLRVEKQREVHFEVTNSI
ncbi:UNVERIFIED_CONTAM: hypothetical protein Sradi_0061900 [Sesamum radiatum]|uniref:Retrotransposon Copia-like N-terminal domain-containing protein n=1 Tax=Sesamum radiatum TaxID=300843 RepID=A0AAW2WIK9_SESRA